MQSLFYRNVQIEEISVPGYLLMNMESDFELGEGAKILGRGGTAHTIKSRLKNPELISKHGVIDVAIKIIRGSEEEAEHREEVKRAFRYEVAILGSLPSSPFVVKFLGFTEDPVMSIIMKFYPFCLTGLLKNKDFVTEPPLILKIGHDIASGMKVLHENGILHLDLKPRKKLVAGSLSLYHLPVIANILVDIEADWSIRCVICDFGYANFIGTERPTVRGIEKPESIGITWRYASPQVKMMEDPIFDILYNCGLD